MRLLQKQFSTDKNPIMNDTFNAKRFRLLFKKTLLERPLQMFGFTGLLLTLTLMLYLGIKAFSDFREAQNLSFIWGLPLGSCFLASFVFGHFSSKANGSSFLTLPASHFEKWLCGVLIAAVIYPIIFMFFYRAIDSSFVSLFHKSLDPASPFYKELYDSVYQFDFTGVIARKLYPIFLFLTSATLVGSLYFNKLPFIKVAIGFCVLWIVEVGVNWLIARIFFGNIAGAVPFYEVNLPIGKEIATIQLPESISNIFSYSLSYILPAMLLLLSFTRLREKEF
jgi:hypothetical protein